MNNTIMKYGIVENGYYRNPEQKLYTVVIDGQRVIEFNVDNKSIDILNGWTLNFDQAEPSLSLKEEYISRNEK